MPTLVQYSDIAYLIEMVVIGLISLALIAITFSIFFRNWSGKHEHQKILGIRKSLQHEKEKIDITINEIVEIERSTHENLASTKIQLNEIADQQALLTERANEIEKRAEHVALLENEVKQTSTLITERIDKIQQHWDDQLKTTVETVEKLAGTLNNNLELIENKNVLATYLTTSLSRKYDHLHSDKIHPEISTAIETTIKESSELTLRLKKHQDQLDKSFSKFEEEKKTNKNVVAVEEIDKIAQNQAEQVTEKVKAIQEAKKVEVAEEVAQSAIITEEMVAVEEVTNKHEELSIEGDIIIAESAEHATISSNRKDRPKIDDSIAEELTDHSLIGDYSHANPLNKNKNKYSSFFSPFNKKQA